MKTGRDEQLQTTAEPLKNEGRRGPPAHDALCGSAPRLLALANPGSAQPTL
jgi:hypothetical protein